jgi:hypothetical protein
MQRNLHISKQQFETALARKLQIETNSVEPGSKAYFFGEPNIAQITLNGDQPDYIEQLNIISNYLFYNSHKKSLTGQKNKYFITFTHNNETPKDAFKAAVIKQLERKIFSHVEYTFEHEDTNIHAHAKVESKFTLNHTNFKSHIRKHGNVQVKIIKIDNGTSNYINKENPSDIIENEN